jgi:hypothetical protein
VLDPALLTAGLQVVDLGVPPRALIAAQTRVIELVREIGETYVAMFMATGWKSFLEGGATPERLEELTRTVARLQPAAAQALLASFRTEMASIVGRAVEQRVEAELGPPAVRWPSTNTEGEAAT